MAAVCCIAVIMHERLGGNLSNSVAIFFLPVLALFSHGLILYFTLNYAAPSQWLIWGTLFAGDAADFYSSAVRLLWDGEFYTPRGRPIANSLIAGLSAITQFDVHRILIINLLLAGIALSLLGLATWTTHGPILAIVLCAILFDFTSDHGVTVSSELMGFVIGASAFVLLWKAAFEKRAGLFLLGIFALSLVMVIRVGALFILPALLVWATIYPFPQQTSRWRMAAAGLVVVVAVFAVNSIITKQYTPNSGAIIMMSQMLF